MDKKSATAQRPLMSDIMRIFRIPRIIAYSVGLTLSFILIIVWPLAMVGVRVMDGDQFGHWVRFSETWAFAAAIFIILVPLIQEIYSIYKQIQQNKKDEAAGKIPPEEEYVRTHGRHNEGFDDHPRSGVHSHPQANGTSSSHNATSMNYHGPPNPQPTRSHDSTHV